MENLKPWYDPEKLLFIAGPCMIEHEDLCHEVAKELVELERRFPQLNIIFKASFDKANRSSIKSPRGPGLMNGLGILEGVRQLFNLPTTTDVHEVHQVEEVAQVCDVIQIPAFLCRQTDLLVAAARSNKVVNVKKGQFLSPSEMRFIVQKLVESGAKEIWQTERGSSFGYQNLVVDMRSIPIMKNNGCPVIFDATHSVQLPGAGDGVTIGNRRFVPGLSRAALAMGANGLFWEVHPNPDQALSDAANQVPLDQVANLIEPCIRVWEAVNPHVRPRLSPPNLKK